MADETAYAVVSQLHGKLFVLDVGGIKGGYSESVLEALALCAKRFRVKYILIEDNFGDGMFEALLKPVLRRIYPVTTEGVRHHIQKEKRIIDTLEPVFNQHRVVVSAELVRKDIQAATSGFREGDVDTTNKSMVFSLFFQMTRLTRERGALKKDDRIDVLAMAVAYWVQSMAKDETASLNDYKAKLLDDELRKFSTQVFGVQTISPETWSYTGPRRV